MIIRVLIDIFRPALAQQVHFFFQTREFLIAIFKSSGSRFVVDQAYVGKEDIIHTFPGNSQAKVYVSTRHGEFFIETTYAVENFGPYHQASASDCQEVGRHK